MYCKYCYKMIPDGSDFCPICGKSQIKKKRKLPFILLGIVVFLFVFIGLFGSDGSSIDPNMTPADYKAICTNISYEDIARNPESKKGQYFKFAGEVIQVLENYQSVDLRINVSPVYFYDELSYYEDTIYATAKLSDSGDRILEGDIITIYGICTGLFTYESIFGETISIPAIDVGYWEITN